MNIHSDDGKNENYDDDDVNDFIQYQEEQVLSDSDDEVV